MTIHLSQGQLNLLEVCPRKFQYIYLDQLGVLPPAEQQERLVWGNRFHLLMQQHQLGLAIAPFPPQDEPLREAIHTLRQTAPHLFQPESSAVRQSEYRLNLEWEGHLLTVVYDLLILWDQRAEILDWKTYPQPEQSHWLAQNWQTRLYPFVLVETSSYQPDQIAMTYWFVQSGPSSQPGPQSLTFTYSATQHQQTQQDLRHWLQQLQSWLHHYEAGTPFPQVAEAKGHCQVCPFAMRCYRTGQQGTPEIMQLRPVAEIQEVIL